MIKDKSNRYSEATCKRQQRSSRPWNGAHDPGACFSSARFLLSRPIAVGHPPRPAAFPGPSPAGNLFLFAALIVAAACTGCITTDAGTTGYDSAKRDGAKTSIRFPKQLYAEKFKLSIKADGGVEASAAKIQTTNVETIQAQGVRESGNIKAAGQAAPKIGEAVGAGIGAAAKTAITP